MDSWVGKSLWRRDRLPTPVFLGFPCGSAGKESACNAGDLGLRSLVWENPLQKGNAMHSSILAWRIPWTVYSTGVAKSRTGLSDFQFHFHFGRGGNQETTTKLCQGQESLSGCYTANGSKCLQRTLLRSQSAAFQAPGNSCGRGQTGNCVLQPGHSLEGSMARSKHMVVAKLGARKSSTACL